MSGIICAKANLTNEYKQLFSITFVHYNSTKYSKNQMNHRFRLQQCTHNRESAKLSLLALLFLIMIFLAILASSSVSAAEWNPPYKFKNDLIRLGVYPRTPAQMAGFYEGRGFPKNAINETTQYCIVTIGMRNTGKQKIWLDLANWRFYNKDGEIKRKNRKSWKKTWDSLKVPLANQATFTWTSLPEARDLHQDEPVGGNVTLTPTYTPFTIEAKFATGEDKQGKPLVVKIENVRCLKNGEEKSK